MKTKSFIIGWALIVLLAGACSVQAGTIRSYDFNHLSDGSILGQDTPVWVKAYPDWGDLAVGDVVGADGNVSEAIYRDPAIGNEGVPVCTVGNARDWPTSVSFTSADTAVWQSYQLKLNFSTEYQGVVGGATFESAGPRRVGFGVDSDKWYFRSGSGWENFGEATVVDGHWYEVKLVMDFSVLNGLATLYHRDLTLGETGWTQDSILVNKPMVITPNAAGEYVVTGLNFYTGDAKDNPPAGWIDNYVLDDPKIPEPGTLVLLATGLIGLLCYAWRKRK